MADANKMTVKEAIEDIASHNSYSRSLAYRALQEFSETAQESFDASDLDKLLSYTQAEADVPQETRQIVFHVLTDIIKTEGLGRVSEEVLLPLLLKQLKSYHLGTRLYSRDLFVYCAAVTEQPEKYLPEIPNFLEVVINEDSPGFVIDTIEKEFGADGKGAEKPYASDLLSANKKWMANYQNIRERDRQKEIRTKDELRSRGLFECPQDGIIVYLDTGDGFDDPKSGRHLNLDKFELDENGTLRKINKDGISLGASLDDIIAEQKNTEE